MAVTHDFAAARRELLASYPMYFSMQQQLGQQYLPDFTRAGVTGGMALSQDYKSALGRVGGAGTGVAAIGGTLSSTLASTLAAQMRMKFFEMLQSSTLAMSQTALGAGQGGKAPNPYLASGIGGVSQAASMFVSPGGKFNK